MRTDQASLRELLRTVMQRQRIAPNENVVCAVAHQASFAPTVDAAVSVMADGLNARLETEFYDA